MDCGIPFCHEGCPLGNLIPEWNDLVFRDDWSEASERLHATNNFPEFTGRLCPAPCEGACVLGINDDPVTIERIEYEIIERAWAEGWVEPTVAGRRPPASGWRWSDRARPGWPRPSSWPGPATRWWCSSGRRSPAGSSATGSPSSRWRRRCWTGGSTRWRPRGSSSGAGCRWGRAAPRGGPGAGPRRPVISATLAGRGVRLRGAGRRGHPAPRPATCPGRELDGIHLAMEYLKPSNLVQEGLLDASPISAEGKHVVIIGGGDTGADCLGTVHRQRALSVHQLEIMPEPPSARAGDNPWPTWPLILRTSSALEEGGERIFSVTTAEFLDDGTGGVRALRGRGGRAGLRRRRPSQFVPVPGSEFELPCELVLLAMGFLGTERNGVVAELGLELDARGSVAADRIVVDQRGRGVRLRRHDPGTEPDRVGHRRGALGRRLGRPVPDGPHRPARADRARAAGPALSPLTAPGQPGRVAPTRSDRSASSKRTRAPVWGASIISPAPT